MNGVNKTNKTNINYVVREDLDNELLEILSIEILKPNSKPFVVTSWYRPPNSLIDLFSNIDSLLARLDSENVEHYLMGDMNCDLLSSENIYARALLNVTDIYGLKQLIDEPTRVTPVVIEMVVLAHFSTPCQTELNGKMIENKNNKIPQYAKKSIFF